MEPSPWMSPRANMSAIQQLQFSLRRNSKNKNTETNGNHFLLREHCIFWDSERVRWGGPIQGLGFIFLKWFPFVFSIWVFFLMCFFNDKVLVFSFLGGVLVTLDRKPWGIKKIQSLTWPFVRRVFLGESPHPTVCGSKTFKQKEPTGAARWRCFSTVGTESRPKAILILLGWDNRQLLNPCWDHV